MSRVNAFLKKNALATNKEIEFVVSKRFVDEEGKPVPFILRTLKGSEILTLQESATKVQKNGLAQREMKNFVSSLCVACVVEPNLLSEELQNDYGVLTPHDLLDEMLDGGEYMALFTKCSEINGLNETAESLEKEAKN